MPLDRSANLHTLLCIDSRLERFPQSSFGSLGFFKHYISLFSVKLKWGGAEGGGKPKMGGHGPPWTPLGAATTANSPRAISSIGLCVRAIGLFYKKMQTQT